MNELELRAKEIFIRALDAAPAERAGVVAEGCGDDTALREEVESLLAALDDGGGFLETPALGVSSRHRFQDGDWVGRRIGQFTIRSVLTSGGMGVVYLADQEHPERTVALKMLRSPFPSPSAIRRFEYEAEILGRLRHPNIAQIYEAGIHHDERTSGSGTPYFALEFIEGSVDLIEHARQRELDLRSRLKLFEKVCRAVHFAHQKGVIHRDLKPHNVLVESAHDEPKIIDFGIARATEPGVASSMTLDGQVMGTLQYGSPEQCAGDVTAVDIRTDVYSLGAILYELLTGHPPFDLSDMGLSKAMETIRTIEPRRPATIDAKLRGDLETIVQKAMSKERDRRYESAAALGDEIARFLRSEPITARPPSAIYHLRKFSQRNKPLVAGILVSLVALIGGLVAVSLAFAGEARQRRLAETATNTAKFQWKQAERAREAEARQRERAEAATKTAEEQRADAEAARDAEAHQRELAEAATQVARQRQEEAEAARDAEAEQRRRADQLAEAADAHAGLVSRVVKAASPWASGGDTLESMLGALGRAADEVESDPIGTPLNEAAVRLAIAQTYWGFGRLDEAEHHGERALEIFSNELGDSDDYTLRAMTLLSAVADDGGRYDEARAILDRAAEATVDNSVVQPRTLIVLNNSLCRAALRRGRAEEAEVFARKAVQVASSNEISQELRNMASLALADALAHQRLHEEAEPIYLELLDYRRKALGDANPSTLVVQHNYASLLIRSGRVAEARPHLEHVLSARRRVMGEEHSMTLIAMNDLTQVYRTLEMLDEARELGEESLQAHEKHLGRTHPFTTIARTTLSHVCMRQRQYDRCAELLNESIEVSDLQNGPASSSSLSLRHNLGVLYHIMGRYEDAEAVLTEAIAGLRRLHGDSHAQIRFTKQKLAEVYISLEKAAEARAIIDELMATEGTVRDFVWVPGMLRSTHAACLALEGDADGAEAAFREAIEVMQAALGARDYRTRHVINAAIAFCDAHGRDVEAARLRGLLD